MLRIPLPVPKMLECNRLCLPTLPWLSFVSARRGTDTPIDNSVILEFLGLMPASSLRIGVLVESKRQIWRKRELMRRTFSDILFNSSTSRIFSC